MAAALFAHCFTCTKNLRAVGVIDQALTARGIAVLRFDFTGLGESEGDFADTNFSSNLEDLVAAAAYLAERVAPPHLMIGHSLGGAAVMRAAPALPSVRALATIAAPAAPDHVVRHLRDDLATIERRGEATVLLAGRPFQITRQFLDDLDRHDMEEAIADLRRPLLILHAPLDDLVGIDNAAEIFAAARHPKSFVALDGADHLLSDPADAAFAGEVIAAWAARYVAD